jgi:hypothetical protein
VFLGISFSYPNFEVKVRQLLIGLYLPVIGSHFAIVVPPEFELKLIYLAASLQRFIIGQSKNIHEQERLG